MSSWKKVEPIVTIIIMIMMSEFSFAIGIPGISNPGNRTISKIPSAGIKNVAIETTTTTSDPDFKMTWSIPDTNAVTIPCQNVGTFDATLDWGDGSTTNAVTAYNDPDLTHSYAAPGSYQITISGTFPNIYFNNGGNKALVTSVDNLGSTGWTRLDRSFYGCSNMTNFYGTGADVSGVTTMSYMVDACTALRSFSGLSA